MAILQIYDSYSQKLQPFQDGIIPGKVRLYVCGVTVYDHCHVGHGRVFLVTDLLQRFFKMQGFVCDFIRNITDIDDKIIKKAQTACRSCEAVSTEYTASMQQLCDQMKCLPMKHEPKATESIPQIISLIEQLIEKGAAYVQDREVFFSVDSFARYGQLSGQNLQELQLGHRVEVDLHKHHPADFTLWKPSQEGEPAWSSPWGMGRPGWHIECSAMVAQYSQNHSLDFHLGGMDLKFPHHENEIAQSESCFDYPLAQNWVHIGFVTVDGEKMSKSLYNFKYLKGLLDGIGPDALRYFYLSTHYRQPLAFTDAKIQDAQNTYRALCRHLMNARQRTSQSEYDFQALKDALLKALGDDLNTPEALAVLHQAIHHIHGDQDAQKLAELVETLFGIDISRFEEMPWKTLSEVDTDVLDIVQLRNQARASRDFQKADQLRAQLLHMGYELKDTPHETFIRHCR